MYNKPYHYNKKLLFLKYWVWKTRDTFFVALDILKINTNSDLEGVGCWGGEGMGLGGGVFELAQCAVAIRTAVSHKLLPHLSY